MPLVVKEIASLSELTAYLQEAFGPVAVDLACRGQAKEYGGVMKARIDRCLKMESLRDRLRMERAVCQRFREHAPSYLSELERQYLVTRWLELVVMQHYGAPTRLLDWTKSPWVAAFFAVSGGWDSPGYVYIFRRRHLEGRLRQEPIGHELDGLVWGPHFGDQGFARPEWDLAGANDRLFKEDETERLSPWVATFYCRGPHFPRLRAQQGLFTFASKPGLDHWKTVLDLIEDDCFEIRIDSAAKPEILRGLATMGLDGAALFPGADGVGMSMEGFARTWHLPPRHSNF